MKVHGVDWIDVTCTAIKRPGIIDETFHTFRLNLFKTQKCRLIINVDPVGEDVASEEIVHIGKKYFDEVIFNIPEEANFFKAFQWVFSQVKEEFVFYLQDDWFLFRPADLKEMIQTLHQHKNLACIRLPSTAKCKFYTPLTELIGVNKTYYDQPALWKSQFYKEVMPFFVTDVGTEYQLRGKHDPNKNDIMNVIARWDFGVFTFGPLVRDKGRDWLRYSKWKQVYKRYSEEKKGQYLIGLERIE